LGLSVDNIKLVNESRVKNFFAEIINKFDKFYSYHSIEMGKNKNAYYINFTFNKNLIFDHSLIYNHLNINPNKFIEPIKQKITKNVFIKEVEFFENRLETNIFDMTNLKLMI